MKKTFIALLFLIGILGIKAQVPYTHSNCQDPYCLGLLATRGVFFHGKQHAIITLPVPPEGVKEVIGACNPELLGSDGGTFRVQLTFDESVVGDPDACFAVITNEMGYGTSPERPYQRELIYHVEIVVTQ